MTASDPSTQRLQNMTLATAHAWGDPITVNDVTWVEETLDLPLAEVASLLGRSYHAVTTMRVLVRQGLLTPTPPRVSALDRPYRGWLEGMGDE